MNVALPAEITLISMCSGIGGLDLGIDLAAGYLGRTVRVVCFIEIEAYAAAVLARRMEEGHIAPAPIFTDVKAFARVANLFRGKVHGIIAGYPCQPFSAAGKRKGHTDPRHLFPDIRRVVKAVEPVFCFFENVRGHLSLGYTAVHRSLRRIGFSVEPGIFSASECGASHRRERLFILANRSDGFLSQSGTGPEGRDGAGSASETLEHAANDFGRRGVGGTEEGTGTRRFGRRGSSGTDGAVGHPAEPRCNDGQSGESGPGRDGARRSELGGRCDVVADASEARSQGRQLGTACDGNRGGAGNTWISSRTSLPTLSSGTKQS